MKCTKYIILSSLNNNNTYGPIIIRWSQIILNIYRNLCRFSYSGKTRKQEYLIFLSSSIVIEVYNNITILY